MTNIRAQVPIQVGKNSSIPATLASFDGLADEKEHIALSFQGKTFQGEVNDSATSDGFVPLVRMHSECLTGDVFNSSRCDCGDQLEESIHKIAEHGGVIIYLRQEGRGIGLYPKIDAYALQDQGYDTYEANKKLGYGEDDRCFSVAADMLKELGITKLKLLTNNPQKVAILRESGIDVVEAVKTGVFKKHDNIEYLKTKKDKKSHKLDV